MARRRLRVLREPGWTRLQEPRPEVRLERTQAHESALQANTGKDPLTLERQALVRDPPTARTHLFAETMRATIGLDHDAGDIRMLEYAQHGPRAHACKHPRIHFAGLERGPAPALPQIEPILNTERGAISLRSLEGTGACVDADRPFRTPISEQHAREECVITTNVRNARVVREHVGEAMQARGQTTG